MKFFPWIKRQISPEAQDRTQVIDISRKELDELVQDWGRDSPGARYGCIEGNQVVYGRHLDEIDFFNRYSALELLTLMQYLSEEIYCAGWLYDIESELWEFIAKSELEIIDCGDRYLTINTLELLRNLKDEAQGWWMYKDDSIFVPLDIWKQIYARHPLT